MLELFPKRPRLMVAEDPKLPAGGERVERGKYLRMAFPHRDLPNVELSRHAIFRRPAGVRHYLLQAVRIQ